MGGGGLHWEASYSEDSTKDTSKWTVPSPITEIPAPASTVLVGGWVSGKKESSHLWMHTYQLQAQMGSRHDWEYLVRLSRLFFKGLVKYEIKWNRRFLWFFSPSLSGMSVMLLELMVPNLSVWVQLCLEVFVRKKKKKQRERKAIWGLAETSHTKYERINYFQVAPWRNWKDLRKTFQTVIINQNSDHWRLTTKAWFRARLNLVFPLPWPFLVSLNTV